jgi:hypothetical protein
VSNPGDDTSAHRSTWLMSFVLFALAVWRVTHLLVEEDGPVDVVLGLRRAAGSSRQHDRAMHARSSTSQARSRPTSTPRRARAASWYRGRWREPSRKRTAGTCSSAPTHAIGPAATIRVSVQQSSRERIVPRVPIAATPGAARIRARSCEGPSFPMTSGSSLGCSISALGEESNGRRTTTKAR